ncbi:hypothetical protein MXF20_22925 [Pantoea dispersa]|nr:hypothetical protein [Pantoea dispersa]
MIITDCNMSKMNGYQFTKYIREYELQTGRPAI